MARRHGGEAARQRAWGRVQASSPALPPCEVDDLDPRLTAGRTEHEARVADDLLDVLTESVAQVAGRYIDPDCRALRHPSHVCHNRDGAPLQRFQSCWVETCLQVQEQGAVLVAAEQAVQA